ncbi:MAG: tetratricopeptide repeat protein, partial [Gemmataceae bacterium]
SVIECLGPSVDQAAEDPGLAYGILAEAYLKLPAPDLQGALEANKKRLGLPTLDEEFLNPARLLQGELLLRLGKAAEAREALARIGKEAPIKILTRARYLQAQSCQEDGRWEEAAELWEEALAAGTPLPESTGRVLCYLGICYRELGQTDKAAGAWEKALNDQGEAGQAAAFALAEVHLFGDQPASAIEFYERALRDVTDAAGYRNSMVDLPEARRLLERGIDHYRDGGAYAQADRLGRLYEKIADKGISQQRRADNADAWAKQCLDRGETAGAQKHFREAGEAYEALARAAANEQEQATLLSKSGERYRQAGELDRAIEVIERQIKIETDGQRTGAAWFALASLYLGRKDHNEALAAFRKCIEFPGVYALRARYRLAAHDIDLGKFDDAEAALKQNLELLRLLPDPETHEQTLFTLANLLFRRGDYARAAARLQEALDHYPGNQQSYQARYHLAESYRQLADQETRHLSSPQLKPDVRLHHREQYRKWLNMALANFQKLAYDLAAKKAKQTTLSNEEEAMLRQSDFAIGDCQINLGQYPDAIKLYEILAARYHHQVEHLLALRQVWRCHWIMREPDKARGIVEKIRGVLNEMDESAFLSHPSKQTRKEWLDWIDWATKQ